MTDKSKNASNEPSNPSDETGLNRRDAIKVTA